VEGVVGVLRADLGVPGREDFAEDGVVGVLGVFAVLKELAGVVALLGVLGALLGCLVFWLKFKGAGLGLAVTTRASSSAPSK
jgi:hypothetical protein